MAVGANTGIFSVTMRDVIELRPVAVPPARTGVGQAVFFPGEWRSLAAILGLSPRECGIVRAVFDGDSEKRIAERTGLSPHTVHTYLWRIYRKLQVQSREELLVRVFAEFRSLPKRGTSRQ
jgi:DNA-binding CsgD family transcriptional regulator